MQRKLNVVQTAIKIHKNTWNVKSPTSRFDCNYSKINVFNQMKIGIRPYSLQGNAKGTQSAREYIIEMTERQNKRESYKLAIATLYSMSVFNFFVGASFAFIPLYKIFCSKTGGAGQIDEERGQQVDMSKLKIDYSRPLTIKFVGTTAMNMRWDFVPQQSEVKVYPGETALAFFRAKNRADKDITGISTYTIIPFDAAQYFNKIQCFCFEEQRLMAGEEVDMPVFFYVDPDYSLDPSLEHMHTITLNYTFFESRNFDWDQWMEEQKQKLNSVANTVKALPATKLIGPETPIGEAL